MQNRSALTLLILFSFTCCISAHAGALSLKQSPLNKKTKKKILKGNIFVQSIVNTRRKNGIQKLKYKIAGLHPKSCRFALRKLSRYQDYNHFIDFIKLSHYDDKRQKITLFLAHKLMPFDMSLKFKIPRITKVGVYPFSFDAGILKGLSGTINIFNEKNNRCFFLTRASWSGPNSGINDTVFELSSSTLGRIAMEKLFRVSTTY